MRERGLRGRKGKEKKRGAGSRDRGGGWREWRGKEKREGLAIERRKGKENRGVG